MTPIVANSGSANIDTPIAGSQKNTLHSRGKRALEIV
ncbi:MAG: hypothetical protein S4CHLAM20_11460 [Chlamydiia bacterium]|nr:hypothetical protein [Chlamydiia bacterium]